MTVEVSVSSRVPLGSASVGLLGNVRVCIRFSDERIEIVCKVMSECLIKDKKSGS